MTLIAALTISNLPVLIGDALLSGEESGQNLAIPTIGNISDVFPEGSGYTITGLRQKINIIDDNLVIGWAGSYIAAKTILSELKRQSNSKKLTRESIHDFFREIYRNPSEWGANQEVAFLGYIADSESIEYFEYSFNDYRICHTNYSRYGDVKICGSGKPDMEDLVTKISRPSLESGKIKSDFDNVVIESLTICGWLFSYEMSTSKSLLNFYGGAYEIATLVEGRFQKLNDLTYLAWVIENIDTDPKVNLVQKGFKLAYIDDLLCIYTLNFDGLIEITCTVMDENTIYYLFPPTNIHIYFILPIYKDISESNLNKILEQRGLPRLTSEFNCNYLFQEIIYSGKIFSACKPLRSNKLSLNPIEFIDRDNQWFLAIEHSYLEYLRNTFNGSTNS
jgi:hypothetical protein